MKASIKKISIFLFTLLILCGVLAPTETVFAADGKLSVSASSTSVNIGDTVKITAKATGPSSEQAVATMTLTFDSDILQFQSCSSSVYGGGGNTVTVTGDSFTVTLKAVAAGKSKISLSGTDGVIFSSTEELDSMSSDSTSVTVNNSASDNGNSNSNNSNNSNNNSNTNTNNSSDNNSSSDNTNTSTDTAKSADNSLQSLTLSAGTLSPAFQYNVVKYTATVPNSVTNLSVTAVTSNKAATVESVTGNTDLVVGTNEIKIVVKAENGVTATYTVTVTREAASADSGTTGSETKDETPSSETETETENTTGESISVDNVSYNIVENFAAETIPADFAETTVTYHEKSYKGLVYNHGTQVMLYLVKADTAESSSGKFFIYDETRDCFYPFVRLTAGDSYVIALYAPVNETIPDNYVQTTASVGEETISAYQIDAEDGSDFYLFYGINHEGTEGWYQYDKAEGTYQRLNSALSTSSANSAATDETDDTEEDDSMTYLRQEYTALSETYAKEKTFSRTVMAILIFVIAILIVVIINLLLQGKTIKPKTPMPKKSEPKKSEPKESKPKTVKPQQKKAKGNLFLQRPDDVLNGDLDEPFDDEPFDECPKQQNKKETKKENIDVIDFNDL